MTSQAPRLCRACVTYKPCSWWGCNRLESHFKAVRGQSEPSFLSSYSYVFLFFLQGGRGGWSLFLICDYSILFCVEGEEEKCVFKCPFFNLHFFPICLRGFFLSFSLFRPLYLLLKEGGVFLSLTRGGGRKPSGRRCQAEWAGGPPSAPGCCVTPSPPPPSRIVCHLLLFCGQSAVGVDPAKN